MHVTLVTNSHTNYYNNISALALGAIENGHTVRKIQLGGHPCILHQPTPTSIDLGSTDLVIFTGPIASDPDTISILMGLSKSRYAIYESSYPWSSCNGRGALCFGGYIDCDNKECPRKMREVYSKALCIITTSVPQYQFLKIDTPRLCIGPPVTVDMYRGDRRINSRITDDYIYVGPTCPISEGCKVDGCTIKLALANTLKYVSMQNKNLFVPPPMSTEYERYIYAHMYLHGIYAPVTIDNYGTYAVAAAMCSCDIITNTLCTPYGSDYCKSSCKYSTYNMVGLYQHYLRATCNGSKIVNNIRTLQSTFWKSIKELCI